MFLAFLLEVNKIELIILLIFSCIVFCTEALNTSIEKLGDAITLDDNEQIKFAKDIGAAAALISAFFSFIVGLWIFLPKIFKII
jgi:diacylglycerol kinase